MSGIEMMVLQIPKSKVKLVREWLRREIGASLCFLEGDYYQTSLSAEDGERLKAVGCRVLGAVGAMGRGEDYLKKRDPGIQVGMLVEWEAQGLMIRGMVDEVLSDRAIVMVMCMRVPMRQEVALDRLRPWVSEEWRLVWG